MVDGVPTLAGGASLAGSTLTMDMAFRNAVKSCGLSLVEAVAGGLDPWRRAARPRRPASSQAGSAADIVVLDAELKPRDVMSKGEWVKD